MRKNTRLTVEMCVSHSVGSNQGVEIFVKTRTLCETQNVIKNPVRISMTHSHTTFLTHSHYQHGSQPW